MKKFTIFIICLCMSAVLLADEWIGMGSGNPVPAQITLESSDISTSIIQLKIEGFYLHPVETQLGEAFVPVLEETTPLLNAECPDLLKATVSVIIPDLSEMDVEVIGKSFTDFENVHIAPSKGNLTRDIDPASVPFTYGKVYSENKFYPGEIAALRDPYIIRDYRGQTVIFYPFQYNPVTKILRVYNELTVRVFEKSNNGFNPLIRENPLVRVDEQFSKIYAGHFLNYGESKYTPVEEQGNMLIISYGSFMTDMQPFVNWKNTIGIPTEMVDVATIGNSAAIKTYIANYYTTNGLTFVLLVGDAAQVPTSYASGDSDNNYSYVVGSDHYPDLFVGRFSAESNAHVQTQVQRTIEYEQTPYTGYDWYTKCIGIASSEGPGDDNEYDYQHVRNMQTDLLGYTYTYNYELFDGSQGGNDASGNPTPTMVASNVNSGASIILYTGHGSNTSWSSSGFSSTNVNALTNNDKLPFIWSVACVNGNFVSTTCFAEAWMRATNGGEPSGAIATLMSTINQSWNPPMEGQDEMVDILVESYANNIKRTFGGLSMNGCMKMNDTYGSGGSAMTDTWTCFGDPSVVVRTAVPQTMAVTHNPVILLGSDQFTVNCNVEGALVCLTINNQIIGKEYVSGGNAVVSFDPLTEVGFVKIAITGYNYIPYIAEVEIVPASGPYITFDSYQVNDISGNNNGEADYNENITLHVTLENAGSSPAYNVVGTLSESDPYVVITNNMQSWGTINEGSTSTQNDAFAISISDDVPDQHVVNFDLEITGDSKEVWNASFTMTISAPHLEFGILVIDDNAGGDGNGRLDPGETADLIVPVQNNGNSTSPIASAVLNITSPYITINTGNDVLGQISNGNTIDAIFNITCDGSTPIGTNVDLSVNVDAGNYGISNTFYQSIGLVLEDWETGSFASFPWSFGGTAAWFLTTNNPYEGSYSAQSGAITHSQTSELIVELNVTTADNISFYRKVSSEPSYDFLRFYIDGVLQGSWAGEVPWGQVSYPVSVGMHTFKWIYYKDGSVNNGSDCAWIDYIVFPPISPPPAPADIEVNPQSFEVSLQTNTNTTKQLIISNLGDLDLNYSISKSYISKSSKAYCTSSGGGSDEHIQNVSIGTINNTSGQSYYADYTAISTDVIVGESYPITITNGNLYWPTDQCGIWVDWNQNEDFYDDEPIVVSGSPGVGPYTATITPPANALPGPARMRIQIIYAQTPNPCISSFSYGEVEDYTLNVTNDFNDWLTITPTEGSVNGGGSAAINLVFDATDLEDGDYFADVIIQNNDPVDPQIIVPCTLHVIGGVMVNIQAILEGPFNGSDMNATLNGIGFLPIGQPYSGEPWNYNGTENVGSIPNPDIVDWVLIELRETPGDASSATPATMIARQAGFLLKNGTVVSVDGYSPMVFGEEVIDNLFVVVYHRNHLGVMSSGALPFLSDAYTWSFDDDVNKAYGGGHAHKEISTGVYGLRAGDANGDMEIDNKDKNDFWTEYMGDTGYYNGDFNMNGQVEMNDAVLFWQINAGKCSYIVK